MSSGHPIKTPSRSAGIRYVRRFSQLEFPNASRNLTRCARKSVSFFRLYRTIAKSRLINVRNYSTGRGLTTSLRKPSVPGRRAGFEASLKLSSRFSFIRCLVGLHARLATSPRINKRVSVIRNTDYSFPTRTCPLERKETNGERYKLRVEGGERGTIAEESFLETRKFRSSD